MDCALRFRGDRQSDFVSTSLVALGAKLRQGTASSQLVQLRTQLRSLELEAWFDLGQDILRVVLPVAVDVLEVKKEAPSMRRLPQIIEQVSESWKVEHWLAVADSHAEVVASWFDALDSDKPEMLGLLERACSLYPTCSRLHQRLVAKYTELGRAAEANEATIKFEENWVDRFGASDIPNIFSREKQEATVQKSESRFALPAVLLLAAGLAAWGVFGRSPSPSLPLPTISKPEKIKWNGHSILHLRIKENESRVVSASVTSDNLLLIRQESPKHEHFKFVLVEPRSGSTLRTYPLDTTVWDHSGSRSLVALPEWQGHKIAVEENGVTKITITGTQAQPEVKATRFLSDGSFLFWRVCDHPDRDHISFWAWRKGQAEQLEYPRGVPQIAVPSLIAGNKYYFRYSLGGIDQWHFHAVALNPSASLVAEPVEDNSTVVARFDGGTLVLRPQQTTEAKGDYTTVDSGEVVLKSRSESKRIKLGSFASFQRAMPFAGSLLLQLQSASATTVIDAVDEKGVEQTPPLGMSNKLILIEPDLTGRVLLTKSQGVREPGFCDVWFVAEDN